MNETEIIKGLNDQIVIQRNDLEVRYKEIETLKRELAGVPECNELKCKLREIASELREIVESEGFGKPMEVVLQKFAKLLQEWTEEFTK